MAERETRMELGEYRVLALNDDNHDTCFCDERGFRHYGCTAFIYHLARPHGVTYKVRYVYLGDMPEDMDDIFDAVRSGKSNIPYEVAFEQLWAIGEEFMSFKEVQHEV